MSNPSSVGKAEFSGLDLIDSIPASVAILDHAGVILAVNEGWRRFSRENGGTPRCDPGTNYLEVVQRAQGPCSEEAAAALEGLQSCLRGIQSHFCLEYPCHAPTQRRWFRMQAARLGTPGEDPARVLVMHFDISEARLAEEQSLAKDSRLQLTMEAGHIGTWEWDILAGRSYWNPQEYQLLGLPPGDGWVETRLFFDFVHPEDQAGLELEIQRVIAEGGDFRRHFRIIRADGAVRWLAARGRLFQDSNTGQAMHMFGVNFDITDSKESQERLRESEERLRLLVDGVEGVALLMLDPEGRMTTWNAGAERVFGYSSEEALGQHISSLYLPKDSERAARELEEARLGKCVQHRGWRLTRGAPVWTECTTTALKTEKGQLRGFARLVRVISEQARSEDALHSVVTHSVDGIIMIDARGTICTCKGAFTKIFGYEATDFIGHNMSELLPEPWRSEYVGYLKNYQSSASCRNIGRLREVVGLRKDGSTFPLELTVAEFRLDDEVFFIGIMRDLTERRKLESQFYQAQKMEAIGVLAGGIAHDFNNLLTVINGCSELLLTETEENHPYRDYLLDIFQAGQRAATLTSQLLTFSRQQKHDSEIVNLNQVVQGMEKLLRRILSAEIQLRTETDFNLMQVRCDPHKIEQVLMNLVINARDAVSEGGEIHIRTVNYERDHETPAALPDGRFVAISVRDDGCGMAAELQERIFDPFFTTKGPGKGTGLGLAAAYSIIKQSEGFILVNSVVGQGTTFTVILPAITG